MSRTDESRPGRAVENELAQREAALAADPKWGPERAAIVGAARRWKASWYELGEALHRVRRGDQWKAWGYATFDDYCRRELHLRRETADKMTGSFGFLRARAPEVIERALVRDDRGRFASDSEDEDHALPTYQAVDFWRRAEEASASGDTVDEIRRQVLDEGASLPRLNRQFREVVFPLDEASAQHKRRTELRTATARLTELLAHGKAEGLVPAVLAAELEEPLSRLARLIADA
jgi:hypothetical protein